MTFSKGLKGARPGQAKTTNMRSSCGWNNNIVMIDDKQTGILVSRDNFSSQDWSACHIDASCNMISDRIIIRFSPKLKRFEIY